ncbi:hypothetical protein ACFFNY_19745 [Paenibacillus hodogayensis]|uniref:Uncharacterized protein n=1 Tax=Paenibacillus hodogayensis TaxID=279208 RepID=A0ABV5VZY5_9BACL
MKKHGGHGVTTTVVFLLLLVATSMLMRLFYQWGLPSAYVWISWASFLWAEWLVFRFVRGMLLLDRRGRQVLPAYLVKGTVIGGYFVLLLVYFIVLGSLIRIPVLSFAMVHISTWVVLVCAQLLTGKYVRFVAEGEEDREHRTFFIRQMRDSFASIRDALAKWDHPKKESIGTVVQSIGEHLDRANPLSIPSLSSLEEGALWQMRELEGCIAKLCEPGGAELHLEMSLRLAQDIVADLDKRGARLRDSAYRRND